MVGGGNTPSKVNVIDYVTITTAGNSSDFGDLTIARGQNGSISTSTRGVFTGGNSTPNASTVMDYITIASTGNANDF